MTGKDFATAPLLTVRLAVAAPPASDAGEKVTFGVASVEDEQEEDGTLALRGANLGGGGGGGWRGPLDLAALFAMVITDIRIGYLVIEGNSIGGKKSESFFLGSFKSVFDTPSADSR